MNRLLSKSVTLLLLGFSYAHAIALQDQLDSIMLIDDRNVSEHNKTKAVIGCSNTIKIEGLKCSKKRDENQSQTADKLKLPKSTKTDTPEPNRNEELKLIKSQLDEILLKLSAMTESDQRHTGEIKKQIETISTIQKVLVEDANGTNLPKEIKVIESHTDHDIIEVQSGESLSKYAQKYYKNPRQYHNIHRANPTKIDDTLQVFIGDHLIIPTSETYKYPELPKPKPEQNQTIPAPKNAPATPDLNDSELKIAPSLIRPQKKDLDDPNEAVYVGSEKEKVKEKIDKASNLSKPMVTNEEVNQTAIAWVETKVPKGFTIYDLAIHYYGNKNDYLTIYNANKKIIGTDLKIDESMELKIPITKNFHEQPEFLGIN